MRGLYGIADAGFGDVAVQARMLAAAGAWCVQLRCKGWSRSGIEELVAGLELPVPLIVNDHLGLGDGTHLGQGDGPCSSAGLWGRSTHTLQEIDAAIAEGVDYVGFGPVFVTTTKEGALQPRGLDGLARAVEHSPVPVVAIGGITLEKLSALRGTGVAAWAPISAIHAAADPMAAARAFTVLRGLGAARSP